jgi:hypothetical protein
MAGGKTASAAPNPIGERCIVPILPGQRDNNASKNVKFAAQRRIYRKVGVPVYGKRHTGGE